jgi:hypothetical protein
MQITWHGTLSSAARIYVVGIIVASSNQIKEKHLGVEQRAKQRKGTERRCVRFNLTSVIDDGGPHLSG